MARTILAPTHRADAPPKYICISDSAWTDEILAKALQAGKSHDGHSLDPLHRYLTGVTRYDLGAKDLRDLIKATECLDRAGAEVWTLRILPFDQRFRVHEMLQAGEREKANLTAFVHGVMKLDGASGEAGKALTECIDQLPKERTQADVTRLLECVGDYAFEVLDEVGHAVVMCSRDMSEAEKKS